MVVVHKHTNKYCSLGNYIYLGVRTHNPMMITQRPGYHGDPGTVSQ